VTGPVADAPPFLGAALGKLNVSAESAKKSGTPAVPLFLFFTFYFLLFA
jgi:hypothetical protein